MTTRSAIHRLGGRMAVGAAGMLLLTACSTAGAEQAATPRPTVTETVTETVTAAPKSIEPQTGHSLEKATKAAESAGYEVASENANKGGGLPDDDWRVCFEEIGYGSVTYGAVQPGALCPKKPGDEVLWPELPKVTGATYAAAVEELAEVGVKSPEAESVYLDVHLTTAEVKDGDGDHTVCFQAPAAGKEVRPDTTVTLSLVEGTSCPAGNGGYLDERNDPSHTPPPPPKPENTTTGGGGGSTGGDGSDGGGWNGQCELMSPAGNCYKAGQFCANAHVGMSTHDAGGRMIHCEVRDDGQRWKHS